jgi:hypothetical protein
MAESRCGGAGAAACGPLWAIGWLFTIGYVHLTFWKGVLAVVIWPYFLGAALGAQ